METFHEDRLIAALNKYWRPLSYNQYMDEMDRVDVKNAIQVSGFSKEVIEWIWEIKHNLGDIF